MYQHQLQIRTGGSEKMFCVFRRGKKGKFWNRPSQAVVLNTCNRTEIYVTGGENSFSLLERLLADKSGMEETQLRRISRRFQGKKALEHLYRVTCGMDSMVLGEDEILGQMRQAYLFSCKEGKPGYELNTAFQGALACAKKIKTGNGDFQSFRFHCHSGFQ